MTVDDLIFVGLNGYAVALHRDTGDIVWSNNELRSGYVTLLLDGDRLIVSTNGYIYCLDPLTGRLFWNNPMKGYGAARRHRLFPCAARAARPSSSKRGPERIGAILPAMRGCHPQRHEYIFRRIPVAGILLDRCLGRI